MTLPQPSEPQPIFVGGEWIRTPQTRTITLPYDGSITGAVCEADDQTVDRAIRAAREGAQAMAALTAAERSDLLLRFHAAVRTRAEDFARTIVLESGKTIREARTEVDRGLQTILAAAHAARELTGEVIPMDAAPVGQGRMAITVREPIGIVGAITPFNFPLNLSLHKITPALGAGNAVVHKPSEQTPLSALNIAHALEQAGVPKGAYNVVPGDGETVGRQLVADPRIAMITFTGSIPVGKAIRAAAGLKKVTLELGGNSPVIIEPDANLDSAVSRCVAGGFGYSGQTCISVQRIYVHSDIAAPFLEQLVEAVRKLKIGHPLDETTDIASLISEEAAERVAAWIAEAKKQGAHELIGGPRRRATLPPTILTEVPPTSTISCQEVFGPVVLVNEYRDFHQAIEQVNGTPYGLQAGIFTNDLARAFRAARSIQAGGVLINDVPSYRADHMPYGGVKESGIGREGPRYAMEEMTDLKLICWKV